MLIGQNSATAPTPPATFIFDATTADFEARVLKESLNRPVLVDFWAPWCGPCKQLMPMLEQIVTQRGGKIALAKVNVDTNPELAQAFRVQSVPMVVALYKGQPVTGFAGARPQKDIEHLVEQLIALHNQNQPEALDIPTALKEAATLLDAGELAAAQDLYAAILLQDGSQIDAYIGMIRVMIAAGDLEQAKGMMAGAPDHIAKDPKFTAARTSIDLAEQAQNAGDMVALERQIAANPDNLDLRYDYAEACFAKGLKDQAVDALITIIRINRTLNRTGSSTGNHTGNEDKAKARLLQYFEAWGFADPASIAGRKKLSAILFS